MTLDSRQLTGFSGGKYLVWNVRGALKLRLQALSPGFPVVSGVFLGPPEPPPTVALVSPSMGQVFSLPANIALAASATSSNGQVSQVSFYDNGTLLGAVATPPYNWSWSNAIAGQHMLAAVVLDTQHGLGTSAPVAVSVVTPPGYQTPVVQVTSPVAGSTLQAPVDLTLTAAVSYTWAPIASVQFLVDGTPFGAPLTNSPFTLHLGALNTGSHSVAAQAMDGFGVQAESGANVVAVLPAGVNVVFRQLNLVPQGSWPGVWGSEGYALASVATNLPDYAAVQFGGNTATNWAPFSGDPRALRRPGSTFGCAAAWCANATNLMLDVNMLDGNAHELALYLLDWPNQGGVEAIQIVDAVSGLTLDTRSLTNFSNGAYLVWDVTGHVQFLLSRMPPGVPAVLSGIFFDPPHQSLTFTSFWPPDGSSFAAGAPVALKAVAFGATTNLDRVEFYVNGTLLGQDNTGPPFTMNWTPPAPGNYTLRARAVDAAGVSVSSSISSVAIEPTSAAAVFALTNTTVQGAWNGFFGQHGYVIAGDSTNSAPYAVVGVNGETLLWAGSTTDPRALLRAASTGPVAAAWSASSNLLVDVKFADASFHRVALYFLDWPGWCGSERIDVLDMSSGSVLDHRALTSFVGGVWLAWDVKGHVQFRLTRAVGSPPVVSGIFFGPSGTLSPISVTSPYPGAIYVAPVNLPLQLAPAFDSNNVTRMDFYDGAIRLGSTSNGIPYPFVWTNVPLGNHLLTVQEWGPAGSSNSPAVRFTVIPLPGNLVFLNSRLLADGRLQLNASRPFAQPVRLEATTNLGPGAVWVPLLTNAPPGSQFSFTISDPTNYPRRFYRLAPLSAAAVLPAGDFGLSLRLLSGGGLQFDAFRPGAQAVRLESTTNLAPTAVWLPLATNSSGSNSFSFSVPDPLAMPQRFYRLRALP